jgi:S1-C subfamily serine protease
LDAINPNPKGNTMKQFLAFALLSLAMAFPAHAVDPNLKAQAIEPVVKINQNCSGTIITSEADADGKVKTQILTAKHCIKGKEGTFNIEVTDRGKPIYDKNVWYDLDRSDPKHDISVITLRDTETVYPAATIAAAELVELGDEVYVVGFPMAQVKTITHGMFTGYRIVEDRPHYRATAALTFGNSGGALFQKNGDGFELIGVTSMKARDSEFMNLFVPLQEIRDFLRIKPVDVVVRLPALPKLPSTPPIGE